MAVAAPAARAARRSLWRAPDGPSTLPSINEGGESITEYTRRRRAQRGWLALAIGTAGAFAVVDYALESVILIGGVVVGPLIASLRLGPRPTVWTAAFGVVLATVTAVVEPGMADADQRVASLGVAIVGSLLAAHVARVREDRERVADRLAAQHAVARVGAQATTLEEAGPRMLEAVGRTLGWDVGALWEVDPAADVIRRVSAWHGPESAAPFFDEDESPTVLHRGEGLPGRVWERSTPAWITDTGGDRNFPRAKAAAAAGLRSGFAFPTLAGDEVFGVVEFFSRDRRGPDRGLIDVLATLGTQVGQYIEAKRAEQHLRESEAVKSAVIGSALDCVVTMDADGCVAEFNPAAERTFGYTHDEAVGRELAELIIPPALRERHREGLRRYLETGEGVVFAGRLELEGMRSDGSVFPVELAVQPIEGASPRLFAGYLRDITERRAAEVALRRSRDELDVTLGSLADGVTVQDTSGRLIYANQAAADTIGFDTPEELMAASTEEVMERFEIYDESNEPLALDRLPGRMALAGQEPQPVVVRFRLRTTGVERWSIVKATAVRDPEGRVVRAVNIFEDITDQKRAEIGQRFLAEAGRLLGASLDYATTLRSVAQVAVPSFSDWCAVDVLTDEGILERVAVAHTDPAKLDLARRLNDEYPPDPDAAVGVYSVIRSGRPELYGEFSDSLLGQFARDERHLELIKSVGVHSAMIVPLPAWRGALGVMTFVNSETKRTFDEHDLALAAEVGRRAATAMENARLYSERAYIARTLQHSLLPPHLPEIAGLEVAARYRAAGEGNEVGGDFYDLFDTGDARWAVLIGDVCGKGADAAATTALARYTLRAAAMRERRPSRVLDQLNEALLRQRDDRQFCTVAYASVDVGAHGAELTISCGGHPAPVIVRRDGGVEIAPCSGTLLGVVGDPELAEAAVGLLPGDAIVFYTDGVTEARTRDGLFGADQLVRVVSAVAGRPAADIARHLEDAAAAGDLRDDLAIVVLRVPESENGGGPAATAAVLPHSGELFNVRLPATPEAIRSARHAIDRLQPVIGGERMDDLRLLVSELVTNGLRHGARAAEDWIGLRVERGSDVLRVEVSDPGPGFDAGMPEAVPDGTGGWGLYLVERLATRWGVDTDGRTMVWFDVPLGEG